MFSLIYYISLIIAKSNGMTLSPSKYLESIFLTTLNKAKISEGPEKFQKTLGTKIVSYRGLRQGCSLLKEYLSSMGQVQV